MVRNARIVLVGGLLFAVSVGGGAWAQGTSQFEFGFRAAPELPAPDLSFDCIQKDGPGWPAGSDAVAGSPGSTVRGAYYCTVEQIDPAVDVWGWQMSFTASGCDARIVIGYGNPDRHRSGVHRGMRIWPCWERRLRIL
jgi:hypothetical protein